MRRIEFFKAKDIEVEGGPTGGSSTPMPATGSTLEHCETNPAGQMYDPVILGALVATGKITNAQRQAIISGTAALLSLGLGATDYAALTCTPIPPVQPAAKAVPWTSSLVATDGQLVTLGGSLYQALGTVPAGVNPAAEVIAPATPGQPRYQILARGGSTAATYDSTATYYYGQEVTYLGSRYRLDKPTLAAGTAPLADAGWTPIGPYALTNAEAPLLTSANIGTPVTNLAVALLTRKTPDCQRVRLHWLRLTASGAVSTGAVVQVTFPQPIPAGRTPALRLTPQSTVAATKPFAIVPVYDAFGTNCIGYTLNSGVAMASPEVVDLQVEVQENQNC